MKIYGYNPEALSYYSQSGSRQYSLSDASVKLDVNRFALGVQKDLRNLTAQLLTGSLSSQQWYDESARLLKLSYRATADVARGSSAPEMTNEQRKRDLELLLLLLLLLNGAADAINSGEMPLDGRLTAYISSLGTANNGLYENYRTSLAVNLGYREARRLLSPADHCHDSADRPGCVELAALGWVSIEKLVRLGNATCRQHCKCIVQYRK